MLPRRSSIILQILMVNLTLCQILCYSPGCQGHGNDWSLGTNGIGRCLLLRAKLPALCSIKPSPRPYLGQLLDNL